MDVFEYRTNRTFNIEGVFSILNTDSEMGGLFLRLKNLMVSEIHLEWDIAFLEQYSKDRMVPRGLRWTIHPQQGDLDTETWFHYFNEAGISLLSFLMDRKRARRSILDKEIKEIRDKLLPHKSTAEYINLSTNLKNHLEKEEREQKTKKQKKYSRDMNDYKTGNVFIWQNKEQTVGSMEPNRMEVTTSSDTRALETSVALPLSKRDGHMVHYPPDPHTPKYQYRSPAPQNRGRGKRGRGKSRRNDDRVSYNEQGPRDSSPQGGYRGHDDYYHYEPYPQRTPLRTYNRFSPLREEQNKNYNSHYSYRTRDNDYPERSPYNYNQRFPRAPRMEGFRKQNEGPPHYGEQNGAPEGGGVPVKRKRV